MEVSEKCFAESFENIVKDFWSINCLIRMMKEIVFENSWEMHEGDVDTICEILAEKSERLCIKIGKLKEQLRKSPSI